MTNAKKYLKDNVSVEEFVNAFAEVEQEALNGIHACNIKHFLQQPIQPALTEDEKVILRNIKGYTTITRNIEGNIQAENNDGSFACLCAFNHLFKFIKNGEKYSIIIRKPSRLT